MLNSIVKERSRPKLNLGSPRRGATRNEATTTYTACQSWLPDSEG